MGRLEDLHSVTLRFCAKAFSETGNHGRKTKRTQILRNIFLTTIKRYVNIVNKLINILIQLAFTSEGMAVQRLVSKLFWEEFLNASMLRCDYHSERKNDKHKKNFNSTDTALFHVSANALKNSDTDPTVKTKQY